MPLSASDRNDLEYWVQNKYGIALGASASTVQPQNVPDMAAVWVADDIAQADGSAVSSWTDRVQSIVLAQATASLQPTYHVVGPINGQPTVRFDENDDRLLTSVCASTRKGGHVFVVAKVTDPFGNGGSPDLDLNFSGSSGSLTLERDASSDISTSCSLGPSYWFAGPTNGAPVGTYLFELNSNGSTWEIRQNGSIVTLHDVFGVGRANVGAWFNQLGNPTLRVGDTVKGGNGTGGQPWDVGAIFIVNRDPGSWTWGEIRH